MPTASLLMSLSGYLADTQRLLRDPSAVLYTVSDLTFFINRAMRQRDLDLKLNRLRLSFTLSTGVYDYPLATIASGGSVLDGNANAIIMDVLSIIVMPLGSPASSVRYPLGRWPYTKLAFMLSTSYPTYPSVYALYGTSNIILAPPPAGNYPAEFDFSCYSPDLVNTTDTDIMPYPFTDPVPFLAASFAKVQAQRFDEADGFEAQYQKHMNRVRSQSRSIAVSSPWSDLPRR